MGTITLNKNNRLFWLGRYAERVYQGVLNVHKVQDAVLDEEEVDMDALCVKLGIVNSFTSPDDFCARYSYDRTLPESILCSADAMIGNGMVLREVLGSQTLSYLQMSVSALEAAAMSHSCGVQLQWVLDDIMAFRGCYAEFIVAEDVRNTIRCGASVERLSTMLRFQSKDVPLRRELQKLINRLYKTNLKRDEQKLEVITQFAFSEEADADRTGLLGSVENLFTI